MEEINSPSEEVLKQAIMEVKEPILFKKMLQNNQGTYTWQLLDWSLFELAEKFGNIKLLFRVGYNAQSVGPQWEVNCSTTSMTFSEFIQSVDMNVDSDKWYYFDYKYMQEWFKDKTEIIDSLNWSRFGFNKTGSDSTLWIGSKGAHTNCHQDSYGCNLVAQIHGKKQWLLFPPSSSNFLRPSRIPYEESTVYSKFNFFCPTKEDQMSILKIPDKPRVIILEPGDVLLVPAGWWHYVESLDLSVSVNVWLPIATDNRARVNEAIVKLIATRIGKKICSTSKEDQCTFSYCMKLLDAALKECENTENIESPCKKAKYTTWTTEDLATQYPVYVKKVCELEKAEIKDLLIHKRERFFSKTLESLNIEFLAKPTNLVDTVSRIQQLSEGVINALCHPDVINKVAELLLNP